MSYIECDRLLTANVPSSRLIEDTAKGQLRSLLPTFCIVNREFTIRYVAQYDDPWRLGHECYLGDVLLIAHSTTISLLKFASSHVVISTLVRIQYLLFLTAPVYISFLLFGRNKIFIHSLLQTQFHKFSFFCRQDSFVTENGLSYSTS